MLKTMTYLYSSMQVYGVKQALRAVGLVLMLFYSAILGAAAPDDINGGMRAWYDAYDINGNALYTDNPSYGTVLSYWQDKSGQANHLAQSDTRYQPSLKALNGNYGVKFETARLYKSGDIWSGSVTDLDIFITASTDTLERSWLFSSNRSTTDSINRIGTHVPWGDGYVYWDRGACCTTSRLYTAANISIGTETKYLWNFYASHNTTNDPFALGANMYIIQDGNRLASNTETSTYTPLSNAIFALGAMPLANTQFFDGTVGEAIAYQRTLNVAERNILNSYLAARWQLPNGLNQDQYTGDDEGFYYHVGGIGQSASGAVTQGTSLGLTIDALSDSDGHYLLAGLQNLTPTSGVTSSDLIAPAIQRSQRVWYMDRTPDNASGSSQLSFNLSELGISAIDGEQYALIYRSALSGNFSVLQQTSVSSGLAVFTVNALADGFYAVAEMGELPNLVIAKTVLTEYDPVNLTNSPKAIPGAEQLYSINIRNLANGSPDAGTFFVNDTLDSSLILFTGDLDGNGSPIQFDDGIPSCNLSFNFIDYASNTDDVEFFDGAGDAVYSVTPDAQGYDENIRRIKILPKGSFAAKTTTDTPNCTFSYRTRID